MVAISVDPPAKSVALRKRLGLTFPLYSDQHGAAARAWNVFDPDTEIALAATFVVAPGGQIIYRYLGTSKSDRPSVDQILQGIEGATGTSDPAPPPRDRAAPSP